MTNGMTELVQELKRHAEAGGAKYFGIANLESVRESVVAQGGQFLDQYTRGISAGVTLAGAIVNELSHHTNKYISQGYCHHIYVAVTHQLDQIAMRMALTLQDNGYRARPVDSRGNIDQARLIGVFPHKLAAHLAGMGWIGKSCLLITREHGPRVRWVTVLTDAPLPAKGDVVPEKCGKCRDCVDICPVGAYTGAAFNPSEPREARFDAKKCWEYLGRREREGYARVCGLCVYACPIGTGEKRRMRLSRTTAR